MTEFIQNILQGSTKGVFIPIAVAIFFSALFLILVLYDYFNIDSEEDSNSQTDSSKNNQEQTSDDLEDYSNASSEDANSSNAIVGQLQSLLQQQDNERIKSLNSKITDLSRDNATHQQEIDLLLKQLFFFASYLQNLNNPDYGENFVTASKQITNNFFRTLSKAGIEKIEPKQGDLFDENIMQADGESQPCILTDEWRKKGFKAKTRYVFECHEFGYKYNGKVVEIGGNKRVAKVTVFQFVDK